MKLNGRSVERVQRNIDFTETKLASNRERLMLALASRNGAKVKRLAAEIRRVGELRERWIAEGLERQFPGINNMATA